MSEKQTLVDRANSEIEDPRNRMHEKFGDDSDSHPDGFPRLPKLDAKSEDSSFEQWYDNNVQSLANSLEEFKQELQRRDGNHSKLSAKVEVVTDLLPDRNSN